MSDPLKSWIDADELRELARSLSVPSERYIDRSGPEHESNFEGFEQSPQSELPPVQPPVLERESPPPSTQHHAVEAPAFSISPAEDASTVPPAPEEVQPPAKIINSLAQAREVADQRGLLVREPDTARVAGAQSTEPAVPVYQPAPVDGSQTYSPGPFLTRVHHYVAWVKACLPVEQIFLCDRDGAVLYDELQQPRLVSIARSCAMANYSVSRHAVDFSGAQHVKAGPQTLLAVLSTETRYGLIIAGVVVPEALEHNVTEQLAVALRQAVNGTA